MKNMSALGTIHKIALKPKPSIHTLNVRRECSLSLPTNCTIPPQSCHHTAFTRNAPDALMEKHPLQPISYIPLSLSSVLATQPPQTTGEPKPRARKKPVKWAPFKPQKGIDPFHPLPHSASSF